MNIKSTIGLFIAAATMVFVVACTPKDEQNNDAVRVLGQKLFEFGLAAENYAKADPKAYTPEDERLVFYGYERLQPEFLPQGFNLNVEGITIADVEPGKGPVKVVLNVHETGLGRYFLEVELVEFGEIRVDGKPDLQVALKAIRYANNHRQNGQPSLIAYRADMVANEHGKETMHIIGTERVSGACGPTRLDTAVPPVTSTFKPPKDVSPAQGDN